MSPGFAVAGLNRDTPEHCGKEAGELGYIGLRRQCICRCDFMLVGLRFLSGDEDAFAVWKIGEHGRRSESLNIHGLRR
jgi:hypothetical protein